MKWLKPWLRSFHYAFQGITYGLRTQRNLRFHVVAGTIVLFSAIILGVSAQRFWMLLLAIFLVIVAELFNTAIELVVDLAMPDIHPKAKAAKDIAATAVLCTAVFAILTGLYVFAAHFGVIFSMDR